MALLIFKASPARESQSDAPVQNAPVFGGLSRPLVWAGTYINSSCIDGPIMLFFFAGYGQDRRRHQTIPDLEERQMGFEALIVALVIGAVAGWLAGVVVKGGGFGLVGDIIIGIIGAVVAGWLFPMLGVSLGGGWIGAILSAAVGAIIVLVIIKLIRRA
jgi:uncharacterized membrane protein YeaQ/YmgE (transglycosylase-associated protein family)